MKRTILSALILAVFAAGNILAADAPSAAEQKLRESVRALTLQLRASDNEKAVMQGTLTEAEQKVADLTEQLEKYKKQLLADKEAAEKAVAEMEARLVAKDGEIATGEKSLASWKKAHGEVKAAYEKAVAIGNAKEAERATLAAQVIVLDRQVADQRTRNAALYKTGTEVLSRYEKFGLGTALTSREPFVGTTRVKFENLVQDYSGPTGRSENQTRRQAAAAPRAVGCAGKNGEAVRAKNSPLNAGDGGFQRNQLRADKSRRIVAKRTCSQRRRQSRPSVMKPFIIPRCVVPQWRARPARSASRRRSA